MKVGGGPEEPIGIFLAGVQKAGTTSLHRYMASHSDLSSGSVKETHFFDNEHIDWSAPDYSAFHTYFDNAAPGKKTFEATPIYTFWPPALDRIRRYNPAARLIVLLRDPIERAYSHWAMEVRRGSEVLPFGKAVREGRLRLPSTLPLAPAWRVFSYVERGLYAGQVRRLLKLFPRDQVLFLDSAELRLDHGATLQRVAKFLDLPPFPELSARLDHARAVRLEPQRDDVEYLRTLFAEDVAALSGLTGIDTARWLTMRRVIPGPCRPLPAAPQWEASASLEEDHRD